MYLSPSEEMRQDARDQRMLRDEQDARYGDWLTTAAAICRPPRIANAQRAREEAWCANRTCAECGRRIDNPYDAALVEEAEGARVVCKKKCFDTRARRLLAAIVRADSDNAAASGRVEG